MGKTRKIYFAGSIRGGRDDAAAYRHLIRWLQDHATVLTEHVGDHQLDADGESKGDRFIHDRDMKWIAESDLVVAEVSTPSLGVGYEIGRALEMGKPVVALWRKNSERQLSAMIAGSPSVHLVEYVQLVDVPALMEGTLEALLG